MSHVGVRKDQADFLVERKKWMTSRPPVGGREAGLWLMDAQDVFGQIKYLEITKAELSDDSKHMLELTGTINLPVEDWHYVRADFERLWHQDLAHGLKAICTSTIHGTLFTFMFVCQNGSGDYVTGRFQGNMIR